MKFFQQTYPLFDLIVTSFISKLATSPQRPLTQNDQNNLYFSYMFAMINSVQLDDTADQVYVCVDFSQGKLYTDYIIKTLQAFSNARIIIEPRLSAKTDIYLSDFYSTHIKQQQIIWQNPPTAVDWTELADTIVIIKKQKIAAIDATVGQNNN